MEKILVDQEFQKQAPLKMTITIPPKSDPMIARNDNICGGMEAGLTNGAALSASALSVSGSQSSSHGKGGDEKHRQHKTSSSSSSSHKLSLSSNSKDITQNKDPTNAETQNGFTKPRDHNLSSSSKSRDHSKSSREKEKQQSSSSSSSYKDNHSSSKSKEHSSSSKSETHMKHRNGSSSKHREGESHGNSGREDSSSSNKDGSSKSGEKSRSSDGSKIQSDVSKSSNSSHKDKQHSSRIEVDKGSKGDANRSFEKHSQKDSHRMDKSGDSAKSQKRPGSGEITSPVHVKSEIKSPVKGRSDDDDDTPLFSRLQTVKTESMKDEPQDADDDVPPFSRLQKAKPTAGNDDDDDDDDIPLMSRLDKVKTEKKPATSKKRRHESDDDDEPLSARMEKVKKVKVDDKGSKKRKHEDDDFSPMQSSSKKINIKEEGASPKKGRKKQDDAAEETKWKWWEENKRDEGIKWSTLEHRGPVLAPLYEPLPSNIKFYYDGKVVKLGEPAEEVATFYARMLDHDYTTRELFNSNFFKDWKKVMSSKERELITDLKKCNFNELNEYFKLKSEERKNMSKEDKLNLKKENEKIQNEYGFCIIDGHKQKIGNFKIEPPGLFRGRGDHPKQGMLKKRIQPEDVIINCSKGTKIPPPSGHKWKEVRHDNTVTWLASWSENIQGSIKYIMLNAASKLKGEKDWMKYETARKLHKCVDKIRRNYREDWKSKEMKIRQRSVAMYFIDKLALRAGNEKDEDTADTVGCCSLRVEHITLHEELDGQEFVVEFDFLGKDSIRYYNKVAIEKRVFKNLQLFMENKQDGDDVFDRLNTAILNKHLQSLMDGLTAKVFRTYNASRTLQEQLDSLTEKEDSVEIKMLSYNRANRAVAVLCNHQRAAPKNFDKQMENLQAKIDAKKDAIKAAKKEVKDAKSDYKAKQSVSAKTAVTKKENAVERLKDQLAKLEVQATDKDENKEIALSTSKLNYLDPRITVAWCKKWTVPIEKIYNKTQREKFAWAIDMADEHYHF